MDNYQDMPSMFLRVVVEHAVQELHLLYGLKPVNIDFDFLIVGQSGVYPVHQLLGLGLSLPVYLLALLETHLVVGDQLLYLPQYLLLSVHSFLYDVLLHLLLLLLLLGGRRLLFLLLEVLVKQFL